MVGIDAIERWRRMREEELAAGGWGEGLWGGPPEQEGRHEERLAEGKRGLRAEGI